MCPQRLESLAFVGWCKDPAFVLLAAFAALVGGCSASTSRAHTNGGASGSAGSAGAGAHDGTASGGAVSAVGGAANGGAAVGVGQSGSTASTSGGSPTGGAGSPNTGGSHPDGGADASRPSTAVVPEDTILTPPAPGGSILGTVTGYEISSGCPMPMPSYCQVPIYTTYDRNKKEWWDVLVDEHLFSRVNVVMAHGRGCYDLTTGLDGNGNMCPRLLSNLVDAVHRAGADDVYRIGMWDDTGAYQGARNHVDKLPDGTLFDLADHTSWRFFWDYNMKIWHDTIPARLWYRLGGRPVVAFWSLSSAFFTHQQGNASLLLRDLRSKFKAAYGEDPFFIVDQTWPQLDTTITTDDAQGMNAWFEPPGNNYTYRDWAGSSWGAVVPGFRDPQTLPGCGKACREVPRRDGQALRDALTAGTKAKFSLLEGWTDIFESAGYYRSAEWSFPNQYIDIVREYADPAVATLRFQTESADLFSPSPPGGSASFRAGVTNVARLTDDTGWYVDWTKAPGWVEYSQINLTCGTYRFTARVASATGSTLHLEVDGNSAGTVNVPPSGGATNYGLVHLGQVKLAAGAHRMRLVADTLGASVDWFFLRRSAECQGT